MNKINIYLLLLSICVIPSCVNVKETSKMFQNNDLTVKYSEPKKTIISINENDNYIPIEKNTEISSIIEEQSNIKPNNDLELIASKENIHTKTSTKEHNKNQFANKIFLKQLSLKEKILFKIVNLKINNLIKQNQRLMNKLGDECSKIALKNGDIIEANVLQITPTEVKYKRCDKPNDPETIIRKSDIFSIKAADGEIIYKGSSTTTSYNQSNQVYGTQVEALGVTSFALWLPALFIGLLLSGLGGVIIAFLGFILGIVGLVRANKNPGKFTRSSKGLAVAGLTLNLLTLLIFSIILILFIML